MKCQKLKCKKLTKNCFYFEMWRSGFIGLFTTLRVLRFHNLVQSLPHLLSFSSSAAPAFHACYSPPVSFSPSLCPYSMLVIVFLCCSCCVLYYIAFRLLFAFGSGYGLFGCKICCSVALIVAWSIVCDPAEHKTPHAHLSILFL